MSDRQTIESFDYQWKELPEGDYLLSSTEWCTNVDKYILDELGMTAEEIKDKTVLCAGCGQGRWAFGFEKLGCKVFGFDTSYYGVRYAMRYVGTGQFTVANILDGEMLKWLYNNVDFDIIWCWGVLHHTGDPKTGLNNLVDLLSKDGIIHIMVYGKKSKKSRLISWVFRRFGRGNQKRLAGLLSKFTHYSQHSLFDAFSPSISSNHTEEEVTKWFLSSGLEACFRRPEWWGESKDIAATGWRR